MLSVGNAGGGRGVGHPKTLIRSASSFAALADAWLLTVSERAGLVPAVEAALSIGWTPGEPGRAMSTASGD
jgi:hypothetical protein